MSATLRRPLLLFAVAVVLSACSRAPSPTPAASVETAAVSPAVADAGAIAVMDAAPQSPSDSDAGRRDACLRKDTSIRSADWANCNYGGFARLKNGRGEYREYEAIGGPHDTIDTKLVGVDYGDLDGDGIEEAAVALVQHVYFASNRNTSESGQVYVYSIRNDAVVLVTSRREGRPMTTIKIAKGRILLDDATKYETCRTELAVRGAKLEPTREQCTKR